MSLDIGNSHYSFLEIEQSIKGTSRKENKKNQKRASIILFGVAFLVIIIFGVKDCLKLQKNISYVNAVSAQYEYEITQSEQAILQLKREVSESNEKTQKKEDKRGEVMDRIRNANLRYKALIKDIDNLNEEKEQLNKKYSELLQINSHLTEKEKMTKKA